LSQSEGQAACSIRGGLEVDKDTHEDLLQQSATEVIVTLAKLLVEEVMKNGQIWIYFEGRVSRIY
jgi:hypothetical protein